MAKLSVYNTIDRSQLGGKFVPLIQSGVNNYKILASDLGKEYSPGDAIEITDIGKINVKFRPDEFSVSSEGLNIKTDYDRGVFKGSDGIYIASADSTINVSVSGIKVNRSNLVSRISGAGLKAVGEMIDVNPADDTIDVGMDGIRVNTSALSIPNAHSLAGSGLESVDSNTLYVKSANGTINVSSLGIKVNTSFLAGRYLRSDSNHGITVDTAPLAHAITGSGLVETNGLIGVNVNTATGIIVNDNKLYLNAGAGLHTTNNTVKVKAADSTINVSSSGIKVNRSALSIPTAPSLAGLGLGTSDGMQLDVIAADDTIDISAYGIKVNRSAMPTAYSLAGNGLISRGSYLYVRSADGSIGIGVDGIKVNAASGLETTSSGLYVKSADGSINVSSSGIGVALNAFSFLSKNSSGLSFDYGTLVNYLSSGYGLRSGEGGALYVLSADNTIDVSADGIKVNKSALSLPTAISLSGPGITYYGDKLGVYCGSGLYNESDGALYVKPYDNTISVSSNGIRVHTSNLAGYGLSAVGSGLYVKSSDNTISVSSKGIKVHTAWLAGHGLSATIHSLYVQPADEFIKVASTGVSLHYHNLLSSLTNEYGGSANIKSSGSYLYTAIGDGLRLGSNSAIYVKSADNSITVGPNGIKVNPSALAGVGLSTDAGKLYVQSADGTIGVTSSGIGVNVTSGGGLLTGAHGLYIDSAQLAGSGLTASCIEQHNVKLSVKSADNSISVTSEGIKVAEGFGFPDYSSGVTANQDTEYTADTNCWLYVWVASESQSAGSHVCKTIVIDGIDVASISGSFWSRISIMVPCKKGSTYKFRNDNTGVGLYALQVYKCLE